MGVVSKIIDRVARRNPIEYARKLGVKVGNDCLLYTSRCV